MSSSRRARPSWYITGILLSLFSASGLLSAEVAPEAPRLPVDAQRALDAHDKDVAKLQADMDKEVAKRVKNLQEVLTKSIEAATKRGDLDGAIAIRTKLSALTPRKDTEASAKPAGSGTPAAAERAIAEQIAGDWLRGTRTWTFQPTGSFTDSAPSGSVIAGQWSVANNLIEVKMSNGWRVEIPITGEIGRSLAMTSYGPGGDAHPGTLTRAPKKD